MERIILHSDLNNFFASVEAVLNPEYAKEGKFLAVCGLEEDRHGIVLAKNENAKRMGVKTGDPIWKARQKCPDLITVPPHFDAYNRYSKIVRSIYEEYTDEVEPFGMDECWLDVTHSTSLFGSGKKIADTIRKRVKSETGLSVSVGVSFNKVFAKLCSDLKKPDATTVVMSDDYQSRLWPLPAKEMLGVGYATNEVLDRHGIFTIGDIARTPPRYLEKLLGKNGTSLYNFANGLDTSPVSPFDYVPTPQSLSHGVTCREDLQNNDEVRRIILYLCTDISKRLREKSLVAKSLSICIKDSLRNSREYSMNLNLSTRSGTTVFENAARLFETSYNWENPVRAVTVRLSKLDCDSYPVKFDFFTDIARSERLEKKESAADKIRKVYGDTSLLPASLLCDLKLPKIINEAALPPAIRASR